MNLEGKLREGPWKGGLASKLKHVILHTYWSNQVFKQRHIIRLKQEIRQSAPLPLRVYFLPFQVTPGWQVRHTARRPVQHLPQARWRCRRRQEQQKSARAICCEQVSANCLREPRQRRARASATWVETNIFIYPPVCRGSALSKLWEHNRRQSRGQEEGAGLEPAAEQVHLCQKRMSHNACQSDWWQNTLDSHNHA